MLRYSRAAEIINNEEYLDEADLDEIRREDDISYTAVYYVDGVGNCFSYIRI